MDSRFLMGTGDHIRRRPDNRSRPAHVDDALIDRLVEPAAAHGLAALTAQGLPAPREEAGALVDALREGLRAGRRAGLFQQGGVFEDDFVTLSLVARCLRPRRYLESGVFIGSSLFAFLRCDFIEALTAIDPDLSKLRVGEGDRRLALIEAQDFSEPTFEESKVPDLVYFDDHVNTARRLIEAHAKGVRRVVFDDSLGLDGVTHQLFPRRRHCP